MLPPAYLRRFFIDVVQFSVDDEIMQKKYDDEPIYFTEEGFTRLKEKLACLKRDLPGFIVEAQRTAAYGDRSDNAEYKDAKSTLRRTQFQILSIQEQLKRVVVIAESLNASGKVQLGSTVVLGVGGVQKIFQILGPRETDPTRGRISHESLLGAALLGHVAGDVVTIKTTRGSQSYHILEVR